MKIESGLCKGQVLQRLGSHGANVKLSGTSGGAAGAISATISQQGRALKQWNNRTVGRCSGNSFSIELGSIPAGGPYRLELRCGSHKTQISPFFVGDVWLLAGQSNMEGNGNLDGAAKPHPLIRCFSMRREWRRATEPLHIASESPDRCHNGGLQQSSDEGERYRKVAEKGTGVGLFFAREMLERTQVPQALLCTAHGGTSMEQWDPKLKSQGGDSLYGSMLLSVRATGQPVAGVLWYQGESDTATSQATEYTRQMQKLVAASRRDLRQPSLPWIIAQIARVIGRRETSEPWNYVQEQQRRLPEKIKNLQVVAAIDLALDDPIHIAATSFPRLASRMARAADFLVCGNQQEEPPPQLLGIHAEGNSKIPGAKFGPGIDVVFKHVGRGLQSGSEPRGFTLLDAQGCEWPHCFKTTLHGDTIRLHLDSNLPEGMRLSYGHGLDPACNITDSRDYALPVFGPIECRKPRHYLPFVTAWRTSGVIASSQPLSKIACPDWNALDTQVKTFDSGGFIDEHALWIGNPGHAYFWSWMELSEPMRLTFLMGYDGPFRLWLDGKRFFDDLRGTNPCYPDKGYKSTRLNAGRHQITVGMDTNGGRAWGFFLRFIRLDISSEAGRTGAYAKPSCFLLNAKAEGEKRP